MSDELKIAIEAAKKGAENALKYFDSGIEVHKKIDGSVVTHADRETEEIIRDFILSKDKNAKILGEEGGGSVENKEFWVIDPIDGTRSYIHGIPNWSVIVSLCRDKNVHLGVIYFPISDTIYYAERGKGAFENDKKLHVSSVSNLEEAYIGFGSPRHFEDKTIVIDLVEKTGSSRGLEPTYSACLVVAGKLDAHIDAYGYIWDLAPFKVMVEEAGGEMTRLDGSPWTFEGKGSVMSNGLLHERLLEIINKRK